MYGEGFALILLLTVVTFSYLIFEGRHATKLWNKCKSLISKYNECNNKHVRKNQARYLSLLAFSEWHYRGEGNEYMAISLPQQRKILRLRKTLCPKAGLIPKLKDWWCMHLYSHTCLTDEKRAAFFEKLNLEYYKVLVKLIGECYVQPSEEILLKRNEIQKINKIIASSRPEYRKKKHIGYSCGSLLTDYAYLPIEWDVLEFKGPTFAVEIKPKQGWIPEPERIYQLCTYCLNQYIKLQNGETVALSNYCPMDLFSGQKHRMNNAINSLLKMPQNNIKIFLEGALIYGENNDQNLQDAITNIFEDTSIEKFTKEFCDLITNALLKQLHNSNNHICSKISQSSQKHKKHQIHQKIIHHTKKLKHCDISKTALPQGCVLDRILKLQELDTWGAEQIYERERMQQQPTAAAAAHHNKEDYMHASCVVTRAKKHNYNNCAKCLFHENEYEHEHEQHDIDTIIQKYIMSAIAKDCSLMLTFRRVQHHHVNVPEQNLIETDFGFYAFNIGVFDLYPKPLSCIFKHVRKRWKFQQVYQNIIK